MRSLDPLEGLAAFITVAKHLSFTRAAEELGMSRATVGAQVRTLEAKLGIRLLQRSTRAVVLTEAGAAYFQSLVGIIPQVREAERAALSYQEEVVGRLKVTVPPEFAQLHMGPIIAEFLKRNPSLSIDVTLSHRAVNLIDEGYDLAIRGTIVLDPNLITRPIGDSPLVICASPDYIARHGAPADPTELADHACLHFSGLRWGNVWILNKDGQTLRIPIVPRYLANDGIALRDVAVAGAGITLLPMFAVGAEIRDGRLVRVLETWEIGSVPVHAVYPANKNIASKVRRFTDFLARNLPKDVFS
ncbi:MAG: LysR family transcriptional regulator [Bosea sp.]|nr:LysR family transcriptional regulator [Bosea sp. (in: a-proteobacteria)]